MFCSKCGSKLDLDSNFCPKCGASVNSINNNVQNSSSFRTILHEKKILIVVPIAIVLLLIMIFAISSSNSVKYGSNNRTTMIYMIGSDLESEIGAAVTDISEMLDSKADFKKNPVLIYTGGTKVWNDYNIPSDKNVIYELTRSGLKKLQEYDKKNMINPDTLTEFLNYSYQNYKTDNYNLVLWDHGGGPIYGYGLDEHYPARMMSIVDLQTALKNSPFANVKLELLGFDACLMSSIEIAEALSPYTEYFISSQEVEPGDGWNYEYLKELDNNLNSVDYSKKIIDSYYNYYEQIDYKGGVGLSLIDTSKIDDLQREISDLFANVDDNIELDFNSLSFTRTSSKSYGKADKQIFDLVDLKDLVDHMPSKYTAKKNLTSILTNDVVIYQRTDILGSNGVSIYFPYYNVENIQLVFNKYKKLNFNQEYNDFIRSYITKLTGTQVKLPTISNLKANETADSINVTLPAEVINNASFFNYLIFEKNDDEYFTPIYKGYDVNVDKTTNTISTSINKKVIYVSDVNENDPTKRDEMNILSIGQSAINGGVNYYIRGMVQKWDDSGNTGLDNFQSKPVFLEFFVSETGETKIGKVIPLSSVINDTYYASKESYDLNEWKTFSVNNSSQKILDSNGNYTSDWKLGTIIGLEWTDFEESKDTIKIELKPLDKNKEYYIVFQVFDSQNNNYSTNITKFPN
jgi:hypothetical protein